jgi:hypothetical protein
MPGSSRPWTTACVGGSRSTEEDRPPGGSGRAVFSGDRATYLEQAVLPGGATFTRRTVGRVEPVCRATLDDPGILMCLTPLETGTL